MKFIVEVAFPLEPFNTYVRKGIAGQKLGEGLEGIKPRSCTSPITAWVAALMIIEADSAAQAPHLTEPLMLNFDASRALPRRDGASGTPIRWPGKVRHELTGAIDRHPQEDTCPR